MASKQKQYVLIDTWDDAMVGTKAEIEDEMVFRSENGTENRFQVFLLGAEVRVEFETSVKIDV